MEGCESLKTVQTCAGIHSEFKPLPPGLRLSQEQTFTEANLDVFFYLFIFVYSYQKNLFFQFIVAERNAFFLFNCEVT